jgi:hypothetical protein
LFAAVPHLLEMTLTHHHHPHNPLHYDLEKTMKIKLKTVGYERGSREERRQDNGT